MIPVERTAEGMLQRSDFPADLFGLPFVWIICLIDAKLWLNDKRSL
jgi:hypothetical protein